MNKNQYLNLKIRVCGEETLAITSSTPQSYLLNFARGTPSSLSDSDRYHSVSHADMMSFFGVSPANDPCTIQFFERRFTLSQLSARSSLD